MSVKSVIAWFFPEDINMLANRLSKHFPGIYLNWVELRIVVGLLRGQCTAEIATDIGISWRTVEFYCASMIRLLGVNDTDAMLEVIRQSDLKLRHSGESRNLVTSLAN